jgi:hypothetical protein
VLTGIANLLRDFPTISTTIEPRQHSTTIEPLQQDVTTEHYWKLLLQFARQHTATYTVNDTAVPPGSGHFFENLHPEKGYWNTRQRR